MNALFWLMGILLGFYLVMFLFGRSIGMFFMKALAKMAMKNMEKSSQEYQKSFDSSPFEQKFRTEKGEVVSIPKKGKEETKKSVFGETVDFEELK